MIISPPPPKKLYRKRLCIKKQKIAKQRRKDLQKSIHFNQTCVRKEDFVQGIIKIPEVLFGQGGTSQLSGIALAKYPHSKSKRDSYVRENVFSQDQPSKMRDIIKKIGKCNHRSSILLNLFSYIPIIGALAAKSAWKRGGEAAVTEMKTNFLSLTTSNEIAHQPLVVWLDEERNFQNQTWNHQHEDTPLMILAYISANFQVSACMHKDAMYAYRCTKMQRLHLCAYNPSHLCLFFILVTLSPLF